MLRSLLQTGHTPKFEIETVYGRERFVSKLTQQLSEMRCVTVHGIGGVGKTTVVADYAKRLDRVLFFDFSSVTNSNDADEIVATVMKASPETALQTLATSDAELIVFDHADSISTWISNAIRELDCPIIVTARAPLRFVGESTLPLEPLDESSAIEMFVAKMKQSGRTLPADDPKLASIVRRLGGLPLAIELAAAQAESISLSEFVAFLDDAYLDVGDDDLWLTEQRNLRTAFRGVWEQTHPALRSALCRIAMIPGSFVLADVRNQLSIGIAEATKIVAALRKSGLVTSSVVDQESQFHVLEPIRVLALEDFQMTDADAYAEAVKNYAERWLEEPNSYRATSVISVFHRTGSVDPKMAIQLALRALTPIHFRHQRAARYLIDRVFDLCTPDMTEELFELHCLAAELFANEWRENENAKRHLDQAAAISSGQDSARLSLARARIAAQSGNLEDALGFYENANAESEEKTLFFLRFGMFEKLDENLPASAVGSLAKSMVDAIREKRVSFSEAILAAQQESRNDLLAKAWTFGTVLGDLSLPQTITGVFNTKRQLDIDLVSAWRNDDSVALRKIAASTATWSRSAACHAKILLAVSSSNHGHNRDALETIRGALNLCDHDTERAVASRLAAQFANAAGLEKDRDFLNERYRALAPPWLKEVMEKPVTPVLELFALRAEHERRVSLWNWTHWICFLTADTSSAPPKVAVWKVADEARWVHTPSGKMLNLSRRGPMRKLLWHLVQMRQKSPGIGTNVNDLFDVAWPGETIDHDLMLARVYNSIRALRGMGFEDVILTHDDGYLWDPDVIVNDV